MTENSIEIWTQERLEEGPIKGLWEFPGGGIEEGESPEEAMRREVWEEVPLKLTPEHTVRFFKVYNIHSTANNSIFLFVHLVKDLGTLQHGRWIKIDLQQGSSFLQGEIPPANHAIIDELCAYILALSKEKVADLLWKL
ncbi:MAG: NUDIX domain-containing protein [Bacteriovoracaceae bacterium]|nr:NUDIX domain-containing protein [Bacteriovoracaceae bacterium]